MSIIISPKVRSKLRYKIPPVFEHEIMECFENRLKPSLIDTRDRHRTKPPTRWFIAETNTMRRLKIVFITARSGDHIIKTAYDPDDSEAKLYEEET
jgi:hypothetical protein